MRTDRLFEIMDYKSLLNRSGLQIPTSRKILILELAQNMFLEKYTKQDHVEEQEYIL